MTTSSMQCAKLPVGTVIRYRPRHPEFSYASLHAGKKATIIRYPASRSGIEGCLIMLGSGTILLAQESDIEPIDPPGDTGQSAQ